MASTSLYFCTSVHSASLLEAKSRRIQAKAPAGFVHIENDDVSRYLIGNTVIIPKAEKADGGDTESSIYFSSGGIAYEIDNRPYFFSKNTKTVNMQAVGSTFEFHALELDGSFYCEGPTGSVKQYREMFPTPQIGCIKLDAYIDPKYIGRVVCGDARDRSGIGQDRRRAAGCNGCSGDGTTDRPPGTSLRGDGPSGRLGLPAPHRHGAHQARI